MKPRSTIPRAYAGAPRNAPEVDILAGRDCDEVRVILSSELEGWRGGIGCERCRVNLLDLVVARWGGYYFHLCCVSPAKESGALARNRGWFCGVAVDFPRTCAPSGMFPVERILSRYGIDERILAVAVREGVFTVVPVHTARPPCVALPLLRVVRPAGTELALERLRVRLAEKRLMGLDL